MPETQAEKLIRLRRDLRQSVTEDGLVLPDFSDTGDYRLADTRMRLAQLAQNVIDAKTALTTLGLEVDSDIDTVAGEIRTELEEA